MVRAQLPIGPPRRDAAIGHRRAPLAAMKALTCAVAALALGGSLSGCVAAALPVAAGAAMEKAAKHHRGAARKQATAASTRKTRRKARPLVAPAAAPMATRAALPPPPVTTRSAELAAGDAPPPVLGTTQADAIVAPLGSLPFPPAAPPKPSSYADFTAAAIAHARPTPEAPVRQSVVLDPAGSLFAPRWLSCGAMAPAVVIDLDPGTARFDLVAATTVAAGIVDAAAALRRAGIRLLWLSSAPAAAEDDIRQRLRATGIDGDGVDRLLLIAKPDDRKQTRLRDAARAWCVVAIAGDRRGDFDELFDYLRNPGDAAALEPMFGAGWFVTPLPIA